MAGWLLQIYGPDDRTRPSREFNGDFEDVKLAVVTRRAGEIVRFIGPVDAPLAQIEDLRRLGALQTFP